MKFSSASTHTEDNSWYPKCPECDEPMTFTEDEDTVEQWWYCANVECENLEYYEPDEVEICK